MNEKSVFLKSSVLIITLISLFTFSSCEELFTETPVDKHDLSFITEDDLNLNKADSGNTKTKNVNEQPLRQTLFHTSSGYGNFLSVISREAYENILNANPEASYLVKLNDEDAYDYIISNNLLSGKTYEEFHSRQTDIK